MNVDSISEPQEAKEERGKVSGRTGKWAERDGRNGQSQLSMASCSTSPLSVG